MKVLTLKSWTYIILLLIDRKQLRSFIGPKSLLFTSRCKVLIVLSDGPLFFYPLKIPLQNSDFNSICFFCSSETEADRDRRVQRHFSKFGRCSSEAVTPQHPQRSIFSHKKVSTCLITVCVLWKAVIISALHQIFLFSFSLPLILGSSPLFMEEGFASPLQISARFDRLFP